LDAPFDRSQLTNASRDGETDGLHWTIAAKPIAIDTGRERPVWTGVRVIASVSSGAGQVISAETVRLAKPEEADEGEAGGRLASRVAWFHVDRNAGDARDHVRDHCRHDHADP